MLAQHLHHTLEGEPTARVTDSIQAGQAGAKVSTEFPKITSIALHTHGRVVRPSRVCAGTSKNKYAVNIHG